MLDFSSLQASVKVIYKNNSNIGVMEMPKPSRNLRPQPSPPLLCPRCNSTNTKFCYYNNYSKSQPRYLCKACRRHWTAGGILRDVPVGGGRKNKRTKLADTSQATESTGVPNYTSTLNNSSSLVQRLLNGNPSNTVFPEMLRRVILQTPQQTSFRGPEENGVQGSAQIHAMSDNFGYPSSLIGSRHNADMNLRSYLSGSNAPNFSLSGYAETGLNGFGMAPPLQLIGTENWGSWDDEISELVNMEGKPTE